MHTNPARPFITTSVLGTAIVTILGQILMACSDVTGPEKINERSSNESDLPKEDASALGLHAQRIPENSDLKGCEYIKINGLPVGISSATLMAKLSVTRGSHADSLNLLNTSFREGRYCIPSSAIPYQFGGTLNWKFRATAIVLGAETTLIDWLPASNVKDSTTRMDQNINRVEFAFSKDENPLIMSKKDHSLTSQDYPVLSWNGNRYAGGQNTPCTIAVHNNNYNDHTRLGYLTRHGTLAASACSSSSSSCLTNFNIYGSQATYNQVYRYSNGTERRYPHEFVLRCERVGKAALIRSVGIAIRR